MKKIRIKIKMFLFKLYYFVTVIVFRTKKIFYDKNIRKSIRRHKQALMVIYNHIGYYDTMLLWGVFVNKYVRFIASEEIILNRISKFFFSWNGVITINRENISLSTYTEIRKSLKNGFWIGICPEGHINRTDDFLEFQQGAAQIAIASRTDLLPVYIVPKRKLFWQRQIVYFGNPIAPNGDKKQLTDLLKEKISELAQFHKSKTFAAFFKNQSCVYVLPFIDSIKDDELKTTFYKKYNSDTREYALSRCAWYFLEKIFRSFGLATGDGDITFSEGGKPLHKDICFNISHSGEMIAIVLSRHDCAVDCQVLKGKHESDTDKYESDADLAKPAAKNTVKTAKWVRYECEKKLSGGEKHKYKQKKICHNGNEYIVGALTKNRLVIKRRLVAEISVGNTEVSARLS